MTNKEALEKLKELEQVVSQAYEFALDNAIEALEREETCENLSRGMEMIFECSVCGASTIDRMNWENGDFNYCPNCGRKVEK